MTLKIILLLLIIYSVRYAMKIIEAKIALNKTTKLIAKIDTFYKKGDEFSGELMKRIFDTSAEFNMNCVPSYVSHTQPDSENFYNFTLGYLYLLDVRDLQAFALQHNKNIFASFKSSIIDTVFLPSKIIEQIGGNIRPLISVIVSIVTWVMVFVLNLFRTEIHNWISSLFT